MNSLNKSIISKLNDVTFQSMSQCDGKFGRFRQTKRENFQLPKNVTKAEKVKLNTQNVA